MRDEIKTGDIVIHKASNQKMVALYDTGNFFKCRYLNAVTGLYETQEFKRFELDCHLLKEDSKEAQPKVSDTYGNHVRSKRG